MPPKFLHEIPEFPDLLSILERETNIVAGLIEKDYWIMHSLYGLQQLNFDFEMKGGTSLSKGFGIIQRFSEDIDIQIHPPAELNVVSDPKKKNKEAVDSRKNFYDWLNDNIQIPGITAVTRDTTFDNLDTYNSGGIRLLYPTVTSTVPGMKEGILLEVGFDTVTPNEPVTISSWAFDRAYSTSGIDIIDNRAVDVKCYHPGYTFVEKLQTIVTKFRREQESGKENPNLMRQYYDVFSLLADQRVNAFIGTEAYHAHKAARFLGKDKETVLQTCEALLLSDPDKRKRFIERYEATQALYYKGQPPFEDLLARIHEHLHRL
ncbi:nucleotidyl transferase AbiEii/AbiGii toxin family protein [Flavihumibacter sp. RY-1]|uniref:Nucleotidyl transferase AbiEii/AbiGii toxin family protein n=1 Tax=Flavihumibacter fluminis TaxID=2909236 RepID=A0ABS9BI57_9BACT|nr:nucleotidyl transferase AbiEii/AbiGii toxin family protein [Flavihumibacter fluminis]MCF1715393.1 nucleotidyl transferase AbiEii/AbiGii toxin family protein [Flavihumibacter fluminis]